MGKRNVKSIAKGFKKAAGKKFGIRRMILFGSFATGKAREGSDVDLLVVADGFKSRAAYMSGLYREWHIAQKIKLPVDFICFTGEEFFRLSRKASIARQAMEEGEEI